MGGYKHNSSFWDNRAGRDAPPCFASRPLKRGYEALAPPSIAPSPPGLPPQIGPFYATFQPILGTQKCFPRDFRDQFSKFPKISWIRGLFFKIVSRILGGAKGRFCPVAGGGGSLCVVSCARWPCSPARDGGPVWIARRRAGGVKDYRPGPVSITPARPPIWPGLVGYIGDFQPCGISGPVGPLFCPVRPYLCPGGLSYLPGGDRGPWGLYGGPVGPWAVGSVCLRACGVYLGRTACLCNSFLPCL